VIGSSGSETTSPNLRISSTVGEALTTTQQAPNSTLLITQGFQQALVTDSLLTFNLRTFKASCIGRSNGFAEVDSIIGCEGPYTILWSNGATGATNRNLQAGAYSVQITSADGCETNLRNFTIENISEAPCFLTFYSGITPNNDGLNDTWVINNIEAFPSNKVSIYNRYGLKVFETKGYDNINKVWEGNNLSGNELPSDTYFYVFETDGEIEKGWIELTR
jgi:gliding motility-associated-like protein